MLGEVENSSVALIPHLQIGTMQSSISTIQSGCINPSMLREVSAAWIQHVFLTNLQTTMAQSPASYLVHMPTNFGSLVLFGRNGTSVSRSANFKLNCGTKDAL